MEQPIAELELVLQGDLRVTISPAMRELLLGVSYLVNYSALKGRACSSDCVGQAAFGWLTAAMCWSWPLMLMLMEALRSASNEKPQA